MTLDGSGLGDEEETPPTRSYVEALLEGSLTRDQIECLRSEIADHLPPAAVAAVFGDDDEDGPRTRFHTYTEAERRSAAPEDDDDDDGARTRFHTYTEAERRSAIPDAIDDDDGGRTHFRAYAAASVPHDAYAPTEPPEAAPEDDDEDDARTIFRPSSPVRAASLVSTSSRHSMHSSLPPRPLSNVPPQPAWGVAPSPAPDAPLLDLELSWPGTPLPASVTGSSSHPSLDAMPSSVVPSSRPSRGAPPMAAPEPPFIEMGAPSAFAHDDGEIEVHDVDLPLIDLDLELALADEVPISAPTPGQFDELVIESTYLDALGGPGGVPCLAVSPGELTRFQLGREAGFLLSRVDGESCVDDILDISGLGRLETLRTLYELLQQGVIVSAPR